MKTIFAVTAAVWTAAVGAAATPARAGVPSVLWCHQDLPGGRFANQRFEVQIDSDSDPALYEVHVYAEAGEASQAPSVPVGSTDPTLAATREAVAPTQERRRSAMSAAR